MTSTLVSTLSAVTSLLAPLVTAGTLVKVIEGPEDTIFEFPTAEVIFGPGTVGRNPAARILERQQTRTGVVRVYVARQQPLAGEYAKFAPIIDAIESAFGASPRLGGLADRFDCSGNSGLQWDENQNLLSVDITWAAIDAEVDTFVQDW
jgi:hypothetical protein